jgi:hypothetical protein
MPIGLCYEPRVFMRLRTGWLVVGLALVGAACKDKAPPPVVLSQDGIEITLPPKTDPSHVSLAVKPVTERGPEMGLFTGRLESHFRVLAILDLASTDPQWSGPAAVTIPVDAKLLPKGRTLADVSAVAFGPKQPLWSLPIAVQGTSVRVQVAEPTRVVLVAPLEGITLSGTAFLVLRGTSEMLVKGDCPDYIRPEDAAVKALAAPDKLSIAPDGAITLAAKLTAVALGDGRDLTRPDGVASSGRADAVGASVLFASLFAARNHSVRIAGGAIDYERDGKHVKGYHQWAEAIVDGKAMFVDTTDVAKPRLVPLADAVRDYRLETHRTCAKYPPGASKSLSQWEVAPPPDAGSAAQLPFEVTVPPK